MKSGFLKVIFSFLFFIISFIGIAQTRAGYIDVDSAITFLPEFHKYKDSVESIILVYTDTIRQREDELQQMYDVYMTDRTYSAEYLEKIEGLLQKMQEDLEAYKFAAEEILTRFNSQAEKELYELFEQKMALFCERKDLSALFDKDSSFYCKDCIDCTNEFIKFILSE